MNRRLVYVMLALQGLLTILVCADAQVVRPPIYPRPPTTLPIYPRPPIYPNRPGYPGMNPYAPSYNSGYGYGVANYGYGTGSGNMMSGAANLTNANANMMVEKEEARILREKANQAKLDTKKQAFDQMLYERANTPTYTDNLTKEKQQILTRMMNFPVPSEVADGKTLNVMLPYIQALTVNGAQGQPIPIPQQYLSMLNVSGGGLTGSVGMLRNGGYVDWPPSLRGPQQKKLDELLPAAFNATLANTLDGKMMKQIRTQMKTMRERMREQLAKEEIETSSYMQAIEFYNSLENSVNALERPGARKQLDGTSVARGRNVQELVDNMTQNGLKFAPASPGSENAYQSVHDAFVRYARIAQSSAGFQASNAPLPSPMRSK